MFNWLKHAFDRKCFKTWKENKYNKVNNENTKTDQILEKINKMIKDMEVSKIKYEGDISGLQKGYNENFNNLKEINKVQIQRLIDQNTNSTSSIKQELNNYKEIQKNQINTLKENQKLEFKSLKEVHKEQIKQLEKENENISKNIKEMSEKTNNEIDNLRSLFKGSKSIGSLGEIVLDNLLNDYLGTAASYTEKPTYEKQFKISKGNSNLIVDFAIKHPSLNKHIPIDSKFPLDKYKAIENAFDKKKAISEFRKSLKTMIKEISKKYIENVESTTSFGLMFIPSETLYNYILKECSDIIQFGNENFVYLCAPTNILTIISVLLLATQEISLYKNFNQIKNLIIDINKEYKDIKIKWDKMKTDTQKHFDKIDKDFKNSYKKVIKLEQLDFKKEKNINNKLID